MVFPFAAMKLIFSGLITTRDRAPSPAAAIVLMVEAISAMVIDPWRALSVLDLVGRANSRVSGRRDSRRLWDRSGYEILSEFLETGSEAQAI